MIKKPTDAELLKMMEQSGYDLSIVHPQAYRNFSYAHFADLLVGFVLGAINAERVAEDQSVGRTG